MSRVVSAPYSALKTVEDQGSQNGAYYVIVTDAAGNAGVSGNGTGSNSATAASAATTSVPWSATEVPIIAANTGRKSASIYNNSDKTLYIKYGTGVTNTTSFKVAIASKGYFELPKPIYTGVVTGLWDAAGTLSALVSEES